MKKKKDEKEDEKKEKTKEKETADHSGKDLIYLKIHSNLNIWITLNSFSSYILFYPHLKILGYLQLIQFIKN